MDGLKTHLVSIIAVAMIGAVVTKIVPKGSAGSVIRMLCGGLMALSILSPLSQIRIDQLTIYWEDIQMEGQIHADEGRKASDEAIKQRISGMTTTYILDKAATMGAVLDVEVELDGFLPCAVEMKGAVSPYVRSVLTAYIADHLGITKEAQRWIS